jgi:predicted nucleotidyltransferase
MSLRGVMRLTNALDPVLGSPTKIRLLRALLQSGRKGWTGRELAGRSKVSTAQAARDLGELAEVGILDRTVSGRSYVWRLNPDHILASPLTTLFSSEARLRDDLLGQLSDALRSTPVDAARLFGSFARGDERSDSDVDLYVELRSPRDREQVEHALARVRERVWARFGNPVTALVYTRNEARHPPNPELMISIERDGLDLRAGGTDSDGTN